jgi:1-acyl-sn-glycerol-3-phosphate acyltransferase
MIRASHHPFWTSFMRFFTLGKMRLHFRDVMIDASDAVPGQQAVLLIGNHYSWWDGFAANYLNIKHFNKKFHVMMLEEELRQRRFLSKAGAYSIQPFSRHVLESLPLHKELLKDINNSFGFPTGADSSRLSTPNPGSLRLVYVLDCQMMPSISSW